MEVILTMLGGVSAGTIMKIIGVAVQGLLDLKQKKYEQKMAERTANVENALKVAKQFYGEDENVQKIGTVSILWGIIKYPKYIGANASFTRWTRRLLALIVTITFCYTVILWAANPTVEIDVWQAGDGGSFELFWGLISFPQAAGEVIRITTGSLVVAQLGIISFVLGAFFIPIGNK